MRPWILRGLAEAGTHRIPVQNQMFHCPLVIFAYRQALWTEDGLLARLCHRTRAVPCKAVQKEILTFSTREA